jgi:hypothetical protein
MVCLGVLQICGQVCVYYCIEVVSKEYLKHIKNILCMYYEYIYKMYQGYIKVLTNISLVKKGILWI